ncbi:hypothetical protein MPDQ_004216 [Monascus purpureus]|uniref:Uncharacterized protein n=1 Tax=Monascus purpureus TaxID=5098 RepID=A0A507R229_MONPU|nr:hypothetical protein MPDQ_004216 [Monascus purpureus]BDD63555.1 hypothetical protein MAP00_008430 [Monascus purpureus]
MLPRSFSVRIFQQQCPRSALRSSFQVPSGVPWRPFTSSPPRAKSAANKASSTPVSSLKFAGQRPEGFGKLERKVAKQGEVVLFESPSHRAYIFSAYALGAVGFACSIFYSDMVFRNPIHEFKDWQKVTYGVVCILTSAMGTLAIMQTFRLVKSIHAVSSNGKTYIRFKVNRMVPFLRPRVFDVVPRQIAFNRRLVPTERTWQGINGLVEKKERLTIITFFTAPVKKVNRMFWELFRAVRRVFTQEDFLSVEIEGQSGSFKVDTAGLIYNDFAYICYIPKVGRK